MTDNRKPAYGARTDGSIKIDLDQVPATYGGIDRDGRATHVTTKAPAQLIGAIAIGRYDAWRKGNSA